MWKWRHSRVHELLTGLADLTAALQVVADTLSRQHDALPDRVDALERSRAQWEGEMRGELTRITSVFNAARAAEERARRVARQTEREEDDDAEAFAGTTSMAERDAALAAYASGGTGYQVPSVYPGVVGHRGDATAARTRKWSR